MRGLVVMISLLVIFCSLSLAQSPPFSRVTIRGETKTIYNKVCLFEKGSAKAPFKTEYVSNYDGTYSIDVDIPYDMKKKDNYFYTDMRFWNDENNNGIRDPGEAISQCHFIIWVPTSKLVYMQVYEGPKYPFGSSTLEYNYK